MKTHYMPAFTRRHASDGTMQAVCGIYVASDEHSTHPTCPICEAWLSETDAGLGTDRRTTSATIAAQNAAVRLTGAAQHPIDWVGKHQTPIIRDMRKTAEELGIVAALREAHDSTAEFPTRVKLADAIEALTGVRP